MSKLLQSYLRFWTKWYLKRAKPKIIAITGSVGKTSTKNAIFEVLRGKYGRDVRKSEGNLNNETGVPLAILGIKKIAKEILAVVFNNHRGKNPRYFFLQSKNLGFGNGG